MALLTGDPGTSTMKLFLDAIAAATTPAELFAVLVKVNEAQRSGVLSQPEWQEAYQAYQEKGKQLSPAPPPAGTPAGGGLGSAQGTAPTSEAVGPYTNYLQGIGLGGGGYWNPAQQYQANLYDPLRSLFTMREGVNEAANVGTPGTTAFQAQPWGDFLSSMGGNMGNIKGEAANTLNTLFGIAPGTRREQGLSYEPEYDPMTGETLTGSETGQQGIESLQELVRLGLASKYGGIGARWLASRLPQMQQTWQSAQAGGAPITPWVDYLKSRVGPTVGG